MCVWYMYVSMVWCVCVYKIHGASGVIYNGGGVCLCMLQCTYGETLDVMCMMVVVVCVYACYSAHM